MECAVEVLDGVELEVQCDGVVYCDGDGGLEVSDFTWTLEGAEIPEPAADALADSWNLEELFLEEVWANLYLSGSVKVGGTYELVRQPYPPLLPLRVEVLAVCKLRNEIRWQVVARDTRLVLDGGIHLLPVCDFYDPSWTDQDKDGPRYRLATPPGSESLPLP
jgi:hypothetical protein